ncbi:Longifolia 1-like [Thalictrum thalictroides]|uniref:Longifolia 1-like n=1 Tax=Thalictrum thalictroides TaxID=46969 RepID=A0A7J6WCF9_THATH|nr:Longifolia 1-like [Thalictrum thalictroides]
MILEENIDKKKQQVEKQMGCMAGFLQIFDRHQLLAGKRIYTTKRLPSSPVTDSASSQELSTLSLSKEGELDKKVQSSPECVKSSPEPATAPKISIDSELKEGLKSIWKFRESPRLSLDSRAIVDGKGSLYPREIRTNAAFLSATRLENDAEEDENDKQRRSPSVVARLMGLEALPESTIREPLKKPELRRSSSESRSRELLQSRLIDGNIFKQKQFNVGNCNVNNAEVHRSEARVLNQTMRKKSEQVLTTSSPWKSQQQRKNFFDSQDFFPEPKQTGCGSPYKELEKRLKMRGISEPAEDLETLKQILEALQLKGLLHSRRRVQQINNRNFIFEETPIVIMKPSKRQSPPSNVRSKGVIRRNNNVSGESLSPVRGKQFRQVNDRSPKREMRFSNPMSPDRNENNVKSPCSPMRRKPLTVETQRKRNDSVEQRRSSPVHSPKINARKNGSDQINRSSQKINRISMAEISYHSDDVSSSVSESSFSTTSQLNTKLKTEDYKEGKNLLARCDKLLNSIAEISTTESQPSPVSVLDSSFYKDELSPLKRRIDFKDQSTELEEDINWSPLFSPVPLQSNDADFVYVSEIVQASNYISDDETDLFYLLEKQCYKNDSANVSRLHRQLVFDTVTEILNKKKQLPPWKAGCNICPKTGKPWFRQIWLEFLKIREQSPAENLLQVICGVLKKDLADETNNGWGDYAMETSEMVLDIERLIFKDLVGDTIRDLATFAWKNKGFIPKKLVF